MGELALFAQPGIQFRCDPDDGPVGHRWPNAATRLTLTVTEIDRSAPAEFKCARWAITRRWGGRSSLAQAKLNLLIDHTDARLERVMEALVRPVERANWNANHYDRLAVRLDQTVTGLRGPGLCLTLSATPARWTATRPSSWMECAHPGIEPSPYSLDRSAGEIPTTEIYFGQMELATFCGHRDCHLLDPRKPLL